MSGFKVNLKPIKVPIVKSGQPNIRSKFDKKARLTESIANVRAMNCAVPVEKKYMNFIGSGGWILDLALTGKIDDAYPIGRVVNIVGDYSTGKTLLACEMINNVYWLNECLPEKDQLNIAMFYDEREWAFDLDLAEEFNMPLHKIHGLKERMPDYDKKKHGNPFPTSQKVEDLFNNLTYICDQEDLALKPKKKKSDKRPEKHDLIIYVIDSLDSLPDSREIQHINKTLTLLTLKIPARLFRSTSTRKVNGRTIRTLNCMIVVWQYPMRF